VYKRQGQGAVSGARANLDPAGVSQYQKAVAQEAGIRGWAVAGGAVAGGAVAGGRLPPRGRRRMLRDSASQKLRGAKLSAFMKERGITHLPTASKMFKAEGHSWR
jgi:hypothetical protein